jgi:hypothetical protein
MKVNNNEESKWRNKWVERRQKRKWSWANQNQLTKAKCETTTDVLMYVCMHVIENSERIIFLSRTCTVSVECLFFSKHWWLKVHLRTVYVYNQSRYRGAVRGVWRKTFQTKNDEMKEKQWNCECMFDHDFLQTPRTAPRYFEGYCLLLSCTCIVKWKIAARLGVFWVKCHLRNSSKKKATSRGLLLLWNTARTIDENAYAYMYNPSVEMALKRSRQCWITKRTFTSGHEQIGATKTTNDCD